MGAGTVHGIRGVRAYSLAFALVAVAGFASREALAGDDCHDGSCHASRNSCGSGGGGSCGSRVSYSRYGDCGSRYGNWGRSFAPEVTTRPIVGNVQPAREPDVRVRTGVPHEVLKNLGSI